MISQTLEKPITSNKEDHRGGGRFTAEQIASTIARYRITATSQFTAEEIAVMCLIRLEKGIKRQPLVRGASRRHHRSHRYGDCHWAGK